MSEEAGDTSQEAAGDRRAAYGHSPGAGRWIVAGAIWCLSLAGVVVATRISGISWSSVSPYGIVVITYLISQLVFAHLERRRQSLEPSRNHDGTVTVVVPAFNEPPERLTLCVKSILRQRYEGMLFVVVVDDGSDTEYRVDRALAGVETPPGRHLNVVTLARNRGKRHAHYAGFERAEGEYVVTVDSDTVLSRRAISSLVGQMDDESVGAVTGAGRIGHKETMLAQLIDLRYWCAFNQERCAQSYFGVVVCLSGILSIYRRDFIENVKDKYVQQSFGGRRCTFGDDRHLTNLVLYEGLETRMATRALCWTGCPTTILDWMRQQLRWSKSFYREFLWSMRFVVRKNWYFAYSLVIGAALPLALLFGLAYAGVHVAGGDWATGAAYACLVSSMGLLRTGYAIAITGDARFLLLVLYAFVHLVCVVPMRLLAIFTITDTRWGTR